MVAAPADYPWSSYRERMGECTGGILDSPPPYLSLGDSEYNRRVIYEGFMASAIPIGEWELIREAVQRNQLTGNDRFVDEVKKVIGRRVERRGPGRPSRDKSGK
jgi:putative transposase